MTTMQKFQAQQKLERELALERREMARQGK